MKINVAASNNEFENGVTHSGDWVHSLFFFLLLCTIWPLSTVRRSCAFSGCNVKNVVRIYADWQLSLKLMRSRFLPLLTPVVFIARLSSGRLRQERQEGGRRGPSKFTTPQFLPQTQSCFHYAPLHDMLYCSWSRQCLSRSNENDFHWHFVDQQELVPGTVKQTC